MRSLLFLFLFIPLVCYVQISEPFDSFNGPGEWTSPGGNTGSHSGELCYNITGNYLDNQWYIFESPIYDFSTWSTVELLWYQESDIRNGDNFRIYVYDQGWYGYDISGLSGYYGITLSPTATLITFDLLTFGSGSLNGKYSHVRFLEIYDPTPLPVELTNFKASVIEEGVLLEWGTASENASSHYSIYRSQDGEAWKFLQDVPAAGYSTSNIEYTYIDHTILFNDTYYRLDQVDIDGLIEEYGPEHVYRSREPKILRRTNLWGQSIDDNYQGPVIINGKIQYQQKNY